jgi:hypothetical protein
MKKYLKKISLKCAVIYLGLLFNVSFAFSQNIEDKEIIQSFSIGAPKQSEVPTFVKFINEDLSKTHVNSLFLHINYKYQFKSHPEISEKEALSFDDIKKIVNACKKHDITIIPVVNLLGHQSWKQDNISALLRAYPQFEENAGEKLLAKDFYCRSYCPLHPEVHTVVFDLLDELIDVFEAKGLHVGLDEVFILGEDSCSRCKGKNKAELFAGEVTKIYNHLSSKNVSMYMWGDRLLDGETTGLGMWCASKNGTYPAIDLIPKDVIICDWQYRTAPPTPSYFAIKGFKVISCSFQFPEVAQQQLQSTINIRKSVNPTIKSRMLGVMHTYWSTFDSFYRCYKNENCDSESIGGAIKTFKTLYP